MKMLSILLIVIYIKVVESDTILQQKDLIANGEIFNSQKYPYVVVVIIGTFSNTIICSGSLVSPLFVLTAGHCTYELDASIIMVCRDTLANEKDCQSILRIHQHSSYNLYTDSADISMLRLKHPFDEVGRYAILSGHPGIFEDNKELKCLAIGFGETNKLPGVAGHDGYIVEVIVKYGPRACHVYFRTWTEFLCSKPDHQMICAGDSGGPLICRGFQYGIASHAYNIKNSLYGKIKCGSTHVQTRHLFVYPYKDWVLNIIKNTGKSAVPQFKLCVVFNMFILFIVL